jgi:DNA-nicking Smr family endonuclease
MRKRAADSLPEEEVALFRDAVRGATPLQSSTRTRLEARSPPHGLNREQARFLLADFLGACLKRGARCVRVIHGKGLRSPGREPMLKGKVRQGLAQRDEVLAFCQAPPNEGGSGALLVLLRAKVRSKS